MVDKPQPDNQYEILGMCLIEIWHVEARFVFYMLMVMTRIPAHSNWKRIPIKTERQGICYLRLRSCLMHGSETWPLKVEHELTFRTEMSMIRWMCGVKLNERKKSEELRELLGLEPVSLIIKKSRLRWFGHVERKDVMTGSNIV